MKTVSRRCMELAIGSRYTDYHGRTIELTAEELGYFRQTVANVLAATGIDIPVHCCDHEKLPGTNSDALGVHWRSIDGADEFITIDNYFIHEAYAVAFLNAFDLNGETLTTVLCHELAHIRYQRHTRYHAALTAQYIDMCNRMEAAA